jgi:hypothetical protein
MEGHEVKMCKVKLDHQNAQGVINELSEYYLIHRAIILTLLSLVIILTSALVVMSVWNTESQIKTTECKMALENAWYEQDCLR